MQLQQILFQGEYTLDATITDNDTGEEVACYHVEVAVGDECTGLGCLIGRK